MTLRTKHPFNIARAGTSGTSHDVFRAIVRIEHDGVIGYGEAAPISYYRQSVETVEQTIARIKADPSLLGDDPTKIGPIMRRLVARFDDQRAALAAVDAAIHDWVGRRVGWPVWRLLGLDPATTPPTSMTIGIDDPEMTARKVAEASRFNILKVKVGTDRDEETLSIVRRHAPDALLRLDANGGWPPQLAVERIRALARFKPELIEQPIPAGDPAMLAEIQRGSPVPIYVDEDCVRPGDVLRLAGAVTGVNIKLAKCGGIREALRMIELARGAGLKVMFGCMVESSLGISAAAQIASLADLVDLDGHLLLESDPFDATVCDGDRVLPSPRAGLGADAERFFSCAG